MRTYEIEEFEPGDKVRLGDWVNRTWYEKYDPAKLDVIMTVNFQYDGDVWTDKGIVEYDCLELVEE